MTKHIKELIFSFYHLASVRRKTYLLVAFMLLSLSLLGILTWQAVTASRAHQQVAIGVAKDYARLAINDYAKTLKTAVGYWTIHEIGTELQNPNKTFDENIQSVVYADPSTLNQRQKQARKSISNIIRVDNNTQLSSRYGKLTTNISLMIDSILKQVRMDSIGPFKVLHRSSHSFVLLPLHDKSTAIMVIDNTELAWWFQRIYDNTNLIPASLIKQRPIESVLYLSIVTHQRNTVFDTKTPHDAELIVTKTLSSSWEGLFENYTVVAAIGRDFIPELVIGGLPASRLPVLLTLISLALIVMLASFWLILKEQKLNKMRADFIANVSHELRTPLTQIRLYTETLLLGRITSAESQHKYLSIINRETRRLSQLIDNILSFSNRFKEDNAIQIEYIDINDYLHKIITEYSDVLLERNNQVEFKLDLQPYAYINPDSFTQVIINLIDNAKKYGPIGQIITISSYCDDKFLYLSISDQGPGIPIEQHSNIWLPFFRQPSSEQKAINGNGIGLAIVKDLTNKMHGTVSVANLPAGGASFTLTFPY